MKRQILILAIAGLATSLLAAEGGAKEDVINAAKKLADKGYSWKTTVAVPESSQFKPGPTEGKTEKDGYTYVKMSMRDNTTEVVIKGEKATFTNQDGEWQSAGDGQGGGGGGGGGQGPGRFMAGMVRSFKAPAVQAEEVVKGTKDLKKDGDIYSGDLTEEGAKALMRFGRGGRGGGGGGQGPEISNAKGSAKFWVKDGMLSKFEYKVTGSMSFNGNDIDVDRTTTVEIKDAGNTKVEVPEGAKKKLS